MTAIVTRNGWQFVKVIGVTPAGKELYVIAHNYAKHKYVKVRRRLRGHPRFHVHPAPRCASWLNVAERFFRDLTQNRSRRGVLRDVKESIIAIGEHRLP